MLERLKFLLLGLGLPIVFGLVRFSINQGDYYRHEVVFIGMSFIIVLLAIQYALRVQLLHLRLLGKKEWVALCLIVLLKIGFVVLYTHFFAVSSVASQGFSDSKSAGYSLSLLLTVMFFGPIEEELTMRGFLLKGVFSQSMIGLVLTSTLFAIFHGPNDVVSFIFYAISGLILGLAYKYSDQLLLPILAHMAYNSFVILLSFF